MRLAENKGKINPKKILKKESKKDKKQKNKQEKKEREGYNTFNCIVASGTFVTFSTLFDTMV